MDRELNVGKVVGLGGQQIAGQQKADRFVHTQRLGGERGLEFSVRLSLARSGRPAYPRTADRAAVG